MTLNIEEDLILPFIVGLSAIIIAISTFYISVSHHEYIIEEVVAENAELFTEVSIANREITSLTHQLAEYHATEESLISLGASHAQAVAVIKAAEVYSLDPKH